MIHREHLLVVDDDPALLEQAELILEDTYEVSLAISGQQALAYLERGQEADLILLDILMPELDGYQTMEAIRQVPGHQNTPVIFLTSLTDPEAELQGLSCGAADFITKPFDARILRARVERRLGNGFQLDEAKLEALPEQLTDTEWKVAKLLARSYSNDEICQELHYALDTVKKMVSRILEKLQIRNRKEIKQYLKT